MKFLKNIFARALRWILVDKTMISEYRYTEEPLFQKIAPNPDERMEHYTAIRLQADRVPDWESLDFSWRVTLEETVRCPLVDPDEGLGYGRVSGESVCLVKGLSDEWAKATIAGWNSGGSAKSVLLPFFNDLTEAGTALYNQDPKFSKYETALRNFPRP